MITNEADLRERLKQVGLRITQPRMAVLRALADRPHAAADTVIEAVREDIGKVSIQAVYDVLNAFVESGLVRRIEPAGSTARYEVRVGDNHHHVVCRSCADIQDVDCATGQTPCLHANITHGYVIDEAEVVYWGLCPNCQQAA